MFVAKITFVVAEIMFKGDVITSSVVKITYIVAEITLKVAVVTSLVAKITFVINVITFVVAAIISNCDHFCSSWDNFDHFLSGQVHIRSGWENV